MIDAETYARRLHAVTEATAIVERLARPSKPAAFSERLRSTVELAEWIMNEGTPERWATGIDPSLLDEMVNR